LILLWEISGVVVALYKAVRAISLASLTLTKLLVTTAGPVLVAHLL